MDQSHDAEVYARWWGKTELAPHAGLAVYERGHSGELAADRIYDDADPPRGVAD